MCDAGEVELVAVEDDAVENIGVGVPGAGEERSQWRIAPSEPPETRIGCTGCHARAFVGYVSPMRQPWGKKIKTVHTANFLFVSTEDDPLLHAANIEDSYSLVT